MEDFFMNDSLQNDSYDQGNISNDSTDYGYTEEFRMEISSTWRVASYIFNSIGFFLTFVAIIYVYRMVRSDSVAPIFIINILISDFIQRCCLFIWEEALYNLDFNRIFIYTHKTTTVATVAFIVCLSLERYLAIAHPLWFRSKQSCKTYVVVSVIIWASSIVSSLSFKTFSIYLILSVPLLVFCLVQTLRALCTSVSVPSDEKRTIAGILILVSLYVLLCLSCNVVVRDTYFSFDIWILVNILLKLRSVSDLVLFVFIRKETISKMLSCKCCCRLNSNDNNMTANNGAVAP